MLLEGLQLPLTTPFYTDGRLNFRKLEHNAARYSKTPVAGLVALSDSGEPTMLSEEETGQTLRSVADAAGIEKVLIAGVSRDSVVGTLDLVETAAKLGYDAVLVKQPAFYSAGASGKGVKELLTYFQAVGDRSALPVVLYSPAAGPGGCVPGAGAIPRAGQPRVLGWGDGGRGPEGMG